MYDADDTSSINTRPGVVTWFKVYAGFMMLLYLLCFGFGVMMVSDPDSFVDTYDSATSLSSERAAALYEGYVYTGLGGVLSIVFGVSLFLRRGKVVWVYDLVLICIGLTSCLCMPVSIPLLIFWLKPENKDWFYGAAPVVDEWGAPGPGPGLGGRPL